MINVIGYESEFKLIYNDLINKKLNNSILIKGAKGIGKFFFIKKIIEEFIKSKIENNQINKHLSLFENNSHPNIKIIKKEIDEKTKKTKNNITIDQIRDLNHFSQETSSIDDFPKFILIDSADDLNINSSNALLKLLEEPKSDTYFFLISHYSSLLLPTIKSRCLKIYLNSHNYDNFKDILISNKLTFDDELYKFLFDITNGSPGIIREFDYAEFLEIFADLIISITDYDPFSDINIKLIDNLSNFENDKLKIYLSLIKFILITFKKIQMGINIHELYLSSKILKIENFSDSISLQCISNKLEYLINNENDLFRLNLDKKIFMINFFSLK